MSAKSPVRLLCALFLGAALVGAPSVFAQDSESSDEWVDENFVVPTPGELEDETRETSKEQTDDETTQPSNDLDSQANEEDTRRNLGPPPEVQRDLSKLPLPVRRMRELILAAAATGEIEKLRDLVGIGETATTLSIGGLEGDPIDFLKEASGDDDGYEILAILTEVLEAGYVRLDAGEDDELYVWPYFFAWPMNKLSPPQKVELYRVLTAGDVEDSRSFGGYVFYRVGIKPDGSWSFFVAGD
ncbi:MAG: cytoplasmic protein [Rhizobiaceae bacterium]